MLESLLGNTRTMTWLYDGLCYLVWTGWRTFAMIFNLFGCAGPKCSPNSFRGHTSQFAWEFAVLWILSLARVTRPRAWFLRSASQDTGISLHLCSSETFQGTKGCKALRIVQAAVQPTSSHSPCNENVLLQGIQKRWRPIPHNSSPKTVSRLLGFPSWLFSGS